MSRRFSPQDIPHSLYFDGVNQDVDMGNNIDLDWATAFSFSFWMKPSNLANAQTLLGKRNASEAGYNVFYLGTATGVTHGIRLLLDGGATALDVDSDVGIDTSKWTHVVVTYDGGKIAAGVNFYFDSVLQGRTVNTDTLAGAITNSRNFRLGLKHDNTLDDTGWLTNVRVHTAELTQGQVSNLYYSNGDEGTSVQNHYDFKDGQGTTLTDIVGGINGTIDATWSTNTPFKKRLAVRDMPYSTFFDGSNDYLTIDDSASLDSATGAGQARSFGFWIKTGTTANKVICEKGGNLDHFGAQIGAGDILVGVDAGTANNLTSTVFINDNKWHLCVCTYDGSVGILYIDGHEDNRESGWTAPAADANDLQIGRAAGQVFGGNLRDYFIYSDVLTAAEVSDMYYKGIFPTDNLVQHLKMDEGTGDAQDSSGNGNHVTTTSGASWTPDTPFKKRLATRDMPYSLDFDGDTDSVSFGNTFSKSRTDAFSYSFWVNPRDVDNIQTIFQKRDSNNEGISLDIGTVDNIMRLIMEDTDSTQINIDTDPVFDANKWCNVHLTYDGSVTAAGINIYVNGSLVGLTVNQDNLGAAMTNSKDFKLGIKDDGSQDFNGSLTDFRVHDAELTADEVSNAYYNNTHVSVEGYWNFADGTGTTLTAVTGGVNGTITNASWSTDTPHKKRLAVRNLPYAGDFDGSASLIDFGDVYDKERTDSFSFSFWMFARDRTAFGTLYQKRNLSNTGYDSNFGNIDGKFQLVLEGSDTGLIVVKTDDETSINKWHHVVFTYDGSSTGAGVNIYVDSAVQSLTVTTDTLAAAMTNATDFRIGARDDGSNLFNGLITDFRIHNAELTQANVDDAYYNDIHTSVQDTIAFSEGSGQTVTSTGAVAGAGTGLLWSTDTPFKTRTAI